MASSAGVRRQNSARDKSKPMINLGPPASEKTIAPQQRTHHLVVCGAVQTTEDVWLFGDFLGFVNTFRNAEPAINGDFVNCFPVGEYFNSSKRNDIKFGRRKEMGFDSWDSDDQIAILTRWQYEHRELWWDQVRRELWPTAKGRVLRWIENKSQDVKNGDIVTIVLIGHGDPNGIFIGGKPLNPSELAVAFLKFPPEVQINLILKACSSGAFAKAFRVIGQRNIYVHTSSKDRKEKSYLDRRSVSGRIRNSLFGAAFVETLGLMKDPDEIWTLGKQKKKLEADLSGPLIPTSKISHPQVFSDSAMKKLMKDILSRDYVDITFDCAPKNARRVLSPTSDAMRSLSFSNSGPGPATPMQEYAAAEMILDQEMGLIDTDYPESGDMGVTEMYFSLPQMPKPGKLSAIKDLLATLCYRFHLQERVFIVAESLMALGLLSYEAIYAPMNLCQPTSSVMSVMRGLSCFQYLEQATSFNDPGFGITFTAPVMWFSIVIVRSCTDWTRILNFLTTLPFLGQLQLERVEQVCQNSCRFKINSKESEAKTVISPEFGFWLPHGESMSAFMNNFVGRYSKLKDSCRALEGESKWEDNPMLEDALQRFLAVESEQILLSPQA